MQIKILIVDDDLKIMNTLGKTFTTMLQGYLVLTATSANAGMSMLKEEHPDVVVLDVRMGPVSGMDILADFYSYLEARKIQRKPRFIVMTAYPDDEVKQEALERYKVDAFFMKPFEPIELRNQVIASIRKVLAEEDRQLAVYAPKTNPKSSGETVPPKPESGAP